MSYKSLGTFVIAVMAIFSVADRAFATIVYPATTIGVGVTTSNPLSVCSENPPVTGDSQIIDHCATLTIPSYGAFSVVHTYTWSASPKESATWTVTYTGTLAYTGYVDPKFVVVGITYAPPGPSTNTFVSYQDSTTFGSTSSLSQSFASSTTSSVTSGSGLAVGVGKGVVSVTTSTTVAQTTKNTSSLSTSVQVQNGEKTGGTSNYFAPVDHDYDIIWVWLNAASIFEVGGNTVVWVGYGYDTTDQPSPDIVGIALGYLNGHFGAIPADIQTSLNRAWAATQKFPTGVTAPLTSTDLAHIEALDPFSVSTYGAGYIGADPPSPETADHRFTLSLCASSSSIDYVQAPPSTTAAIDTCTLTYSNTSTGAQDITNSYNVSYSVDTSVSNNFVVALSADVKTSGSLTWTTEAQTSSTETTSSTAALSVQGPPCGNVNAGIGPCAPVYDAAGGQPVQFEIYQDNMFGSFMFAPINYY